MEYNFVVSARGAGKYEAYKKLWMDLLNDEIEEAQKAQNNIVRIFPDDYYIRYSDNRSSCGVMVVCDDSDQAIKVVEWIYQRMTFGNGNVILDLEEFREQENSCNGCLYQDTDACKEWDNDGTGCDAHITEEEAKKDVNEEK